MLLIKENRRKKWSVGTTGGGQEERERRRKTKGRTGVLFYALTMHFIKYEKAVSSKY